MRNTRKYVIFTVVAVLCLFMAMPVLAQPKGGALMTMDAFTPIAQGYDFVREGKLNDGLANLKDASTHADEYFDKVTQTCFAGGGCLAVKPLREKGEKSSIAPIIQENIQKLQAKIAATGTPPPPGETPPMVPPKKVIK